MDGAEARPMEDEYMVSVMYPGKALSYVVAHLTIPFISADNLLKHLMLGQNVVDSIRFY